MTRTVRFLLFAAIALLAVFALLATGCGESRQPPLSPSFTLQLSDSAASAIEAMGLEVPITGRAYVILSQASDREPRAEVGVRGVPFWGTEVRDLAGGGEITLTPGTEGVTGYPFPDMSSIPPGDYAVQAFLNVFTTFHRSDGKMLEMHLNSGAGQDPWRAPGNAMSAPQTVHLEPGQDAIVRLDLSQVIPPVDPVPEGGSLQQGNPPDQGELVRFLKIRSPSVSEFWGRDMYIGANVLLPADYGANPNRRYPVLYLMGHFPGGGAPFGYTEDAEEGRGRDVAFSEFWRSPGSPKLIIVTIRDANPYYDTSYSVNSANVGPYADALLDELIPFLEGQFRIIPEAGARILAGGSTGGWEALAVQIFNPDDFAGSWGWCPDPVDFHYYQIVDVYEDDNAYHLGGPWVTVERPNARRPDGNVVSTVRQENTMEVAVGPDGRSGGQWAIWEALFSPVASNGYAQPIWNRTTGAIDHDVADYWQENWDLTYHLVQNWSDVGSQLAGKLHVTVGDMDTYYLNDAVGLMQEALSGLSNPDPNASFEYGRLKPHCWRGTSPWRPGQDITNAEFVRVVDQYLKGRGVTW